MIPNPLDAFAYVQKDAPYMSNGSLVFPVLCKTGLATTRHGGVVHRVAAMAAVITSGKISYAARWGCCRYGALEVIPLLADGETPRRLCASCHAPAPQPVVYRCFSAAGDLLYVGSTDQLGTRLKGHASKAWWPDVTEVRTDNHATIVDARLAEATVINAERPRHNIRHQQSQVLVIAGDAA